MFSMSVKTVVDNDVAWNAADSGIKAQSHLLTDQFVWQLISNNDDNDFWQ